MTMPLVYIQTYRVCMLCIVYIHLYTVYLFIYNVNKNKRFSSLVFGTILIGLWWSCYTNTLFPVLPLSVILSPLSHTVCMLMSESNVMAYVNNFCNFFRLVNYVSFLFSTDCIWPFFHLNCTRWCTFTFLTDFGKPVLFKGKVHQPWPT